MIAEDFRPVRVLATESLVVPKGAFSREREGLAPRMKTKEHVRAQGEKTGEGAASVLSSGNCAETGQ